jgi:sugar fermentation stimulation protein A
MVNCGIYIAVFYLPKKELTHIGKLGSFVFRRGFYFYVGSAQRNLSTRLERHAKNKKKSLRWHIDYLSVKAKILGAMTITGWREHECEIARELGKALELAMPGFGASDCRCSGHLFYTKD